MNRPPAHASYEPAQPTPFDGQPNLLLAASLGDNEHTAELALIGALKRPVEYWAAAGRRCTLGFHFPSPIRANAVRLILEEGPCSVGFRLEGLVAGGTWQVLAEKQPGALPLTPGEEVAVFEEAELSALTVALLPSDDDCDPAQRLQSIQACLLESEVAAAERDRLAGWAAANPEPALAWGSVDARYARNGRPDASGHVTPLVGWRGERLSLQAVISAPTGASQLRLAVECPLPATARFVRYSLADGRLVPDALDHAVRLDLAPSSCRPVWVAIEVPADAAPGRYEGILRAEWAGGSAELPFAVEVLSLTLAPPAEWSFRLDLWQNPYAVARYHHVEPWSPMHMALLEPHLRMLAEAGQKCVTCSIVHDPWGSQTYDPYDAMVEWVREPDGSWSFDYSVFDTYVELCGRCGIVDTINCYSMVPWGDRFRSLDRATGNYRWLTATPGTPEHAEHWRPFLADFVRHLTEKGWLARTCIAMDERPLAMMLPTIELIREAAPGLGIALAGTGEIEFAETVDDWCAFIEPPLAPEVAAERRERGKPTTVYVCCGPERPNTFPFSPPAESEWLGWYAAAMGYSGFLRWAYDCWGEDPIEDTTYGPWPAGDCYVVYPGCRSSIRFERLRAGIQAYEKIRAVREGLADREDPAAREALATLEQALTGFRYEAVQTADAASAVQQGREALEQAARALIAGP